MAIQMSISYETLRELVKQLTDDQKHDLADYLTHLTGERPLTKKERKALYHSSILSVPVKEIPSIRREDWYGDDGR